MKMTENWILRDVSKQVDYSYKLHGSLQVLNLANLPRDMCCSVLREEFRLVQLRLRYPNAADFAQSPVSFII